MIAAYERGAREPALSTLASLIEAAGVSLDVELDTSITLAPLLIGGPIGRRLRRRRGGVLALAAKHNVTDIRVFGSVARGEEGPDSDLDLLVHLPPGAGLFALGRFVQELEELLHVQVDVVPDDSVRARGRANIDKDLVAL